MTLPEILIGLFLGFLSGYLFSYFKEKGKNKALLSDIQKLTAEKERISSEYKLDIEKRKYKYESKKEQYFKYFNLLDEFGKNSNNEMYENFFPVLDEFNKHYLGANGNKKKELEAITEFSSKTSNLLSKSNENLIRLRAETNTIKLIANSEVLNLLNDIDQLYDLSMEKSAQMLKEMANNIVFNNQEAISLQRQEVELLGTEITRLHTELLSEVKQELNEI
jgi:hypothetical protein